MSSNRKKVGSEQSAVTNDDATYEVGYGKPPKHTRFNRDRQPTRRRRPRRVEGVGQILKDELAEFVDVIEGGRKRKYSKLQIMIKRLSAAAAKGDLRALDRVFDLRREYNLVDPPTPSENDQARAEIEGVFKRLGAQIDAERAAKTAKSDSDQVDVEVAPDPKSDDDD
jgi:ketosteroid isomerase-like protein